MFAYRSDCRVQKDLEDDSNLPNQLGLNSMFSRHPL